MCNSTQIIQLTILHLAIFASGCSNTTDNSGSSDSTDTPPSETRSQVTLALNWYAEAEHGGFIAAHELGYFAEEGVDVDIRQGGPGAPNLVIQELAAGRIPFAVSNADLVVLARAKGVDVVAVAAPLQLSPRCIMVHEASGIHTLQNLANVQLAISDSRPFALWMKKQLPLKNVTMVPYTGQIGEFVLNKDFAQQAYVFSEPFLAQENGCEPRVLRLSDIGFNPYSSLLVTTGTMIRDQPDVVKSVVTASVKGWQSYLQNPGPVNEVIHEQNPDMSLAALAYGADTMGPLCLPTKQQSLCEMTIERWTELVSQIEELGEIEPASVAPASCFNTSFLPQ